MLYYITIETVTGQKFIHQIQVDESVKDPVAEIVSQFVLIKENGTTFLYNMQNVVRIYGVSANEEEGDDSAWLNSLHF